MSITAIKPNGGTPFDQIVRAGIEALAVVEPEPVIRVVVKAPVKAHAIKVPAVKAIKCERIKPTPPPSTLEQRRQALQLANETRVRRAQVKRDLKAGRESVALLLLDPPAYLRNAKVFDMMLAVPKYGRVKANRILRSCAISPSKTIGGLSQRQRAELVELMGRRS
jgi:hypothetical protein